MMQQSAKSKSHQQSSENVRELFEHIHRAGIFDDSKDVADLVPLKSIADIKKQYEQARYGRDFNIGKFTVEHFHDLKVINPLDYKTSPNYSMSEHITSLWPSLTQQAKISYGSLLALPKPYIVPGNRFREQFYWDSYFTMLGLAADDRWDMIENMTENMVYMLDKAGIIPNANRTYLMSRSQPPVFSHIVRLVTERTGDGLEKYLPQLMKEYDFWNSGIHRLNQEISAVNRTVRLPTGEIMNRYYDKEYAPRPESYSEDVKTAKSTERDSADVYRNLRAAAESGWDFSSRWMKDPYRLNTVHTIDIVPVDLNCLLYDLEVTIADAYSVSNKAEEMNYREKANNRRETIDRYFWHYDDGFYYDYDFVTGNQTKRSSLTAVFPLWSGIASKDQARQVAGRLKRDFLVDGGLLTTLIDSGHQWDAPNGWAPLIWVAIQGLRKYEYNELADEVKHRWLTANERIYRKTGKMVEKYNVRDTDSLAGGGEYDLQDGFGWTNGVAQALMAEKPDRGKNRRF